MSVSIANLEREKYEAVWSLDIYRIKCHSLNLWENHREIFPENFRTALDIGCGLGYLMAAWNEEGYDAWGIDIAANCLASDISARWGKRFIVENLWEMELGVHFDLGICADVMEHIPEEFIERTLKNIARHCNETIFSIANFSSNSLGHNLHLTQKPLDWWLGMFQSVGPEPEVLSLGGRNNVYHLRWRICG
ncbi:hypothetical protein LCGC14_2502440 [marine sediment metagenome]|uniref:Uncharacterized protein n=1 Tax=marine sediment metagenome TaxID=412755 RepID=A0A0F9DV79_9ZZZZ